MRFFNIFRRHKIVTQRWLDDTTVWMDCKCGGSIVLKEAKREPRYLDGMVLVGFEIVGRVHASSCKKQPTTKPAPKEPEPTLPAARLVR